MYAWLKQTRESPACRISHHTFGLLVPIAILVPKTKVHGCLRVSGARVLPTTPARCISLQGGTNCLGEPGFDSWDSSDVQVR
jgi:hypothetical protein